MAKTPASPTPMSPTVRQDAAEVLRAFDDCEIDIGIGADYHEMEYRFETVPEAPEESEQSPSDSERLADMCALLEGVDSGEIIKRDSSQFIIAGVARAVADLLKRSDNGC